MSKIKSLIKKEEKRQKETLMLIPSENYPSKEVRKAVGSVLSNKYSEGYPGNRYYQGNEFIDDIEEFAIKRAKNLFKVKHVNVQPYSGSPANSEVLFALLNPYDKIMGMKLSAGGHLTHGKKDITFSGRYFDSVQFGLNEEGKIDYEKVEKKVKTAKPKLLIIGTTAYPRKINWKRFADIADEVKAWFVADISHVSGLVVAGAYPSPVNYAHIVTTTTHKTLRGPRGAMIMVTKKGLEKDSSLPRRIDRAVFPGMQGGPHNNTTAGIAIALEEAGTKAFKSYGKKVVSNAQKLAKVLKEKELELVSGGTDSHLMLVDLRPKGLSGSVVALALEYAGIIVNKNSVPNDEMSAQYPSGIRLGTPAVTTCKMGPKEMELIGGWIVDVVEQVAPYKLPKNAKMRKNFMQGFENKIKDDKLLLQIKSEVKKLCKKYPPPF